MRHAKFIQRLATRCFRSHSLRIIRGSPLNEEKKLMLFGPLYRFSLSSQKALSGKHQGILITDLDLNKDSNMTNQRILSYFLYPNISLRFNNQAPMDSLILFSKKNPLRHIPENYKILISSEDSKYILANQQ